MIFPVAGFARAIDGTDDTLTLEKLRQAIEDVTLPLWARMIQRAEAVEVRATVHIPEGMAYVMDLNTADVLAGLWPLAVICRPEDEERVRAGVAYLRRAAQPAEAPK